MNPDWEEAIQYLRKPATDRILWIDASFINQDGVEKRNSQVVLMHQIYAKADHVLAWVGPRATHSEEMIKFINEANSCNFTAS